MTFPIDLLGRPPVMRDHLSMDDPDEIEAGEAWKGKHLIRIQRVPHGGGLFNVKGARCKVPGCESRLGRNNTTTVCKAHNHTAPYCQCAGCIAKAMNGILK